MKSALVKRLEKLERRAPTDAMDLGFGVDRSGAPAQPRNTRRIDLTQLEQLCMLQCSDQELASWFGVAETKIQQLRKRRSFREATERGRVKGRILVRRAQMRMLEKGSATMARWLGKQILKQGDHVETADRPVPVIVLPSIQEPRPEDIQIMAIPSSKSRA